MLRASNFPRTLPDMTIWAIMLGLSVIAWIPTIVQSLQMPSMVGTMGMAPGPFLFFWTIMMAAMMLPAFAPMIVVHARSLRYTTTSVLFIIRMSFFLLGYLAIWTLCGFPAFVLAQFEAQLVGTSPSAALYIGILLLMLAGLYQFTPLKLYCLTHCNPAFKHDLNLDSTQSHRADEMAGSCSEHSDGLFHDPGSGLLHGLACLGCCGALMLILIPFGLMSLPWMLIITLVVFAEKVSWWGQSLRLYVGMSLIFLAFLVWISPSLIPGLSFL